ncbi:carboxymuconolactone decarboxylase family protein [Streptomyces sp. NPDC001852]|uniref:carboxymuconolactone decarboxylase family protein n=1 Tax=Streptomyces sp. NPDC001852 TaxID=3364619 RepID=UPI003687B83D
MDLEDAETVWHAAQRPGIPSGPSTAAAEQHFTVAFPEGAVVSRLTYPDRQEFPKELREFLDQLPQHAAFDMLSHSQATVEIFLRQGQAQFTQLTLSPRDRELTILTTASATDCAYEFTQHVPISASVGVSDAVRDAIKRKDFNAPELPGDDRAIIRFVAAVIAAPTVSDEIFSAAKERLTPREILEIMQVTGFYWSFGRVCTVLDVEVEKDHGDAVIDASRRMQVPAR